MENYQTESSEWASTTMLRIDDRWIDGQEGFGDPGAGPKQLALNVAGC